MKETLSDRHTSHDTSLNRNAPYVIQTKFECQSEGVAACSHVYWVDEAVYARAWPNLWRAFVKENLVSTGFHRVSGQPVEIWANEDSLSWNIRQVVKTKAGKAYEVRLHFYGTLPGISVSTLRAVASAAARRARG
jgi:hypothetical protein